MMIKKMMILPCILVALFAMCSVALATDGEVEASVTITTPTIDVTNPVAMDFGGIICNDEDGADIVLDSSSNTDATPNVNSGEATLDGEGGSGSLTIESNIDATLDISCSGIVGQGGTNANVLELFDESESITFDAGNVMQYTPGSLSVTADTPTTLYIGGVISVDNATVAGNYGGTVTISVEY